jgi:hypothetical protein
MTPLEEGGWLQIDLPMLFKAYDEETNTLVDTYSNSPDEFSCESD